MLPSTLSSDSGSTMYSSSLAGISSRHLGRSESCQKPTSKDRHTRLVLASNPT
jgi:hypothetical protein